MKEHYVYAARLRDVISSDTVILDIDLGFSLWLKDQPFKLYQIDSAERGDEAEAAARVWLRRLLNKYAPHDRLMVKTHVARCHRPPSVRWLVEIQGKAEDGAPVNVTQLYKDSGLASVKPAPLCCARGNTQPADGAPSYYYFDEAGRPTMGTGKLYSPGC